MQFLLSLDNIVSARTIRLRTQRAHMMFVRRTIMRLLPVFLLLFCFAASAEESHVLLPVDYKKDFVEYLSLDRIQNPDQFIRLFANEVAMRGKNQKGELPNGSVLVAEVYSVKKNEDGTVKNTMLNRRIKDNLLLIAVMEKREAFGVNSNSKINTGNWDFGAYKPNGKIAPKNLDACRGCHAPLTGSDFLFSGEHLP